MYIRSLIDYFNFYYCRYYYHPDQKGSASIKAVLPTLTNLSYQELEINNGTSASEAFEQLYKNNNEQTRQHLLQYCKLDTLAMVEIIKALKRF